LVDWQTCPWQSKLCFYKCFNLFWDDFSYINRLSSPFFQSFFLSCWLCVCASNWAFSFLGSALNVLLFGFQNHWYLVSETDAEANKANRQFEIIKHVLKAFMLRRTKALLIESGVLALPPLTELTVSGSLLQENIFPFFAPLSSFIFNLFYIVFTGWCHWHSYKRSFTCQCWGKSCKHFFHLLEDRLATSLCRTL